MVKADSTAPGSFIIEVRTGTIYKVIKSSQGYEGIFVECIQERPLSTMDLFKINVFTEGKVMLPGVFENINLFD